MIRTLSFDLPYAVVMAPETVRRGIAGLLRTTAFVAAFVVVVAVLSAWDF